MACLLVFLPAQAAAETVSASFAKAQKAAATGHQKNAVQLLQRLLQRYPDHEPSRLFLAHLYFELGQPAKAAAQYRRLPASSISGDIAYEYGVSFFTVKDCGRAVRGFSKVPPKSKDGGLAAFYLGMCTLSSNDCAKAEAHLSRAKGLPSALEGARKKALSRAHACAGEAAVAAAPLPQPQPQAPAPAYPAPQYYGMPPSADPAAVQPPLLPPGQQLLAQPRAEPPAPVTTYVEPAFYLKQRNNFANYFGFKQASSQTLNEDMMVKGGLKYLPAGAAATGPAAQAYLSLDAFVEQNWGQTSGTAITYVTQASQPGTLYSQGSTLPPGSTRDIAMQVNPEWSYPFNALLRGYGGYKNSHSLPNADSSLDNQFNELYAGFDLSDKALNLKLRLSQLFVSLAKPPAPGPVGLSYGGDDWVYNSFTGSATNFDAALSRSFEVLTLVGKFNYAMSQPGTGYYNSGDNSHFRVEFGGEMAYKFGVKVSLTGSLQQSSNVNAAVADPNAATGPSIEATAASATTLAIAGSADLNLVDWCFASFGTRYSSSQYSGLNPLLTNGFKAAIPQVSFGLSAQLGLRKRF